jgi:anthranilate synthase component 2
MLLMIDNYDSFTYNLVQYLGELGEDVHVYRNDKINLEDITRLNPKRIVISPGPCTPNEAGISLEIVERFQGQYPILGVCLGHQCIGQAFGGKVVHARRIMHGKTSSIYHNNRDLFLGMDDPITATRYHSLVLEKESLPKDLQVTAWTLSDDGGQGEIMGIKHNELPIYGVQFHPESILTESGHQLLKNFLSLTG